MECKRTMTRTRQGHRQANGCTLPALDNNREITRLSGGCGEMLSNKDNNNATAAMCSSYSKRREMYEAKLACPCTCEQKGPFKKPCLAADCLNRSFKEAQNFVNSLGKVPGVAGLGLMDITDQPYYGRHREADCTNMDNRVNKTITQVQQHTHTHTHRASHPSFVLTIQVYNVAL